VTHSLEKPTRASRHKKAHLNEQAGLMISKCSKLAQQAVLSGEVGCLRIVTRSVEKATRALQNKKACSIQQAGLISVIKISGLIAGVLDDNSCLMKS